MHKTFKVSLLSMSADGCVGCAHYLVEQVLSACTWMVCSDILDRSYAKNYVMQTVCKQSYTFGFINYTQLKCLKLRPDVFPEKDERGLKQPKLMSVILIKHFWWCASLKFHFGLIIFGVWCEQEQDSWLPWHLVKCFHSIQDYSVKLQ